MTLVYIDSFFLMLSEEYTTERWFLWKAREKLIDSWRPLGNSHSKTYWLLLNIETKGYKSEHGYLIGNILCCKMKFRPLITIRIMHEKVLRRWMLRRVPSAYLSVHTQAGLFFPLWKDIWANQGYLTCVALIILVRFFHLSKKTSRCKPFVQELHLWTYLSSSDLGSPAISLE